jgi:menaquinone-dependent protoporphyrinogen oxidase
MPQNHRPRILVAAGSKHGATAEIADHIAATLADAGCDATAAAPGSIETVEGYDAVVLGSAVYAGHWTGDAKDLANRAAALTPHPPVWLFSSGPLGDPPKPDEDPVDVADLVAATGARDHRIFSGKLDKSKLGFGERAIVVAVRAPEGDFRDWDEIAAWAREIAAALTG